MRILAIRGHNLASLDAPFEIDLTREPLAGTGLFAITGDTGAGKSTILDGLCLALYGEYPRASGGRREKVVDPSGEALEVNDPGNILRRGASRGHAEVDFIGNDGNGYRVRWEIRRARGRANGRLQDAERRLDRLDGSGGIAVGKRDVLAAVVERTGLTFEQFRRTVLLAQGEFDAFLLADEPARAALLEKITGTGVYTAISIRVFEETADRRRALDELMRRRGDIALLDADARETLSLEQAEKRVAIAAADASLKRIEGSLRHADDVARARDASIAAAVSLEQATAAVMAAGPGRERLRLLRAIEPLRPMAAAVAAGATAVREADARASTARDVLAAAEDAGTRAHDQVVEAERQARVADDEVQRFEPEWTIAAVLDTQIATAERELLDATLAEDVARKSAAASLEQAKASHARLAALQKQAGEVRAALAAAAAHAPLSEGLAEIERRLDARASHVRRRTEAQARAHASAEEALALLARLEAFAERARCDEADRARLVAAIEHRTGALAAIDLAGTEERLECLGLLAGHLESALVAVARRDEALGREREVTGFAQAARTDRDVGERRYAAASEQHGRSTATRAELQQLADLAEATLSKRAAELRSTLVVGEPCPVCGAAEHPIRHGDDAAMRIAGEIRARRKALDEEIALAAREMIEAQRIIADAEARRDAAEVAAAAERQRGAMAVADLADLLPRIVAGCRTGGLPAMSAAVEPASVPVALLQAVREDVAPARASLARIRRAAEDLRSEKSTLQERLQALTQSSAADGAAIEADRTRHAALNAESSALTAALELHSDEIDQADVILAPHLAAAGLSAAELARDAAAVGRRIRQLAEAYARRVAASAQLDRACEEAATAHRAADDEARSAADVHARAREAAAGRCQSRDDLVGRRRGMLGGEKTETHRERLRAAASAARKRHEAALAVCADAMRGLEAARTADRVAADSAAAAQAAHTRAAEDLAAAVDALALSPEAAGSLLAVPPDEATRLDQALAALDRALGDARHALALRQHDLEALRAIAAEPDAAALASLTAEQAACTAALETLRRELALIEVRLANDDTARERAGELGAAIDAARTQMEVWEAVDQAIGQRDGARFRRFAQGITLGQLVRLANQQLEALEPRYALAVNALSELSLDIVDRDMGEEVRSPRSLSGGERFLVSLALALALSGLEGRQSFVDTLFIDEGFGALDRDTLDMAIAALEALQGQGRKVGVITHVAAMIERIPVQVKVEMRGGGRSVVRIEAPGIIDVAAPAAWTFPAGI